MTTLTPNVRFNLIRSDGKFPVALLTRTSPDSIHQSNSLLGARYAFTGSSQLHAVSRTAAPKLMFRYYGTDCACAFMSLSSVVSKILNASAASPTDRRTTIPCVSPSTRRSAKVKNHMCLRVY